MIDEKSTEPKRPRDTPPAVNKRREFPQDSDLAPLGGFDPTGSDHESYPAPLKPKANVDYRLPPAPKPVPPELHVMEHRMTRVETEVRHLKRHVDSIVDSLPGKSADEHTEHHDRYADELTEKREKEAEDKKLKREIKEKFIKSVVQGVLMALAGLLLLGLKSQFSDWVDKALAEKAASSTHQGGSGRAKSVDPTPKGE